MKSCNASHPVTGNVQLLCISFQKTTSQILFKLRKCPDSIFYITVSQLRLQILWKLFSFLLALKVCQWTLLLNDKTKTNSLFWPLIYIYLCFFHIPWNTETLTGPLIWRILLCTTQWWDLKRSTQAWAHRAWLNCVMSCECFV